MHYRKTTPKLVQLTLRFRELWSETFGAFNEHTPEKLLEQKDSLLLVMKELKEIETSEHDQAYFTCLSYLVNALFLGVQGYHQTLGGADGGASLNGARLNAEQFLSLSQKLDNTRPSIQHLRKAIIEWKEPGDINAIVHTV